MISKFSIINHILQSKQMSRCNMEELTDLFIYLTNECKLCVFKLSGENLSYSILGKEHGNIRFSRKIKDYYVVTVSNSSIYFQSKEDIARFLNTKILETRKYHNYCFESHMSKYTKISKSSFDVSNEYDTIFTNIISLNHKSNNWIKQLFGMNVYFNVFVSCFYLEKEIIYCASVYDEDNSDSAICSSSSLFDFLEVMNISLKNNYSFEFK